MVRRAFFIAILLIVGAAINVLIDWSLAWNKDVPRSHSEPLDKTWPVELGLTLPPPTYAERLTGVGWTRVHHGLIEPGPPGSGISLVVHSIRFDYGWPYRSMRTEEVSGNRPGFTLPVAGRGTFTQGISVRRALASGSSTIVQLPLRPLVGGFVLNSLLYGALAALCLWPVRVAIRRWTRRRRMARGLCPVCKFPMGLSPVCTECGADLPRRVQ